MIIVMEKLNIKSLPIDLESFGFVNRETKNGKTVKNRCGRDFFYYVFHHFYPEIYNPKRLDPLQIEKSRVFGMKLPAWLIWTGLSFYKISKILKILKLELEVNGRRIVNFGQLLLVFLPLKRISFRNGLTLIKSSIDNQDVCGIDISVALGGLVDHVMFVYGYDDENLYVFDTHKTEKINYEKITGSLDNRFIMRLPYSEIEKRWSVFNRVWVIKK